MLIILGYVIMIIGGILLVIEAFKESILWGIGCLVIPIVGLVFVVMYWDVAKKPFMIQLAGLAICFIGGVTSHRTASLSPHRPAADVRAA